MKINFKKLKEFIDRYAKTEVDSERKGMVSS